MGGVRTGVEVDQLITLSLPTQVEDELGCDNYFDQKMSAVDNIFMVDLIKIMTIMIIIAEMTMNDMVTLSEIGKTNEIIYDLVLMVIR